MAKAWKVEEVALREDTPVDEAAPLLLEVKLAELRHHAVLARARTDPEDTHALRVATRRLRAALQLLGGPLAELAAGVRRLGQALGQLRDEDVMIAWLSSVRVRAEPDEHPGIDRLLARRRSGLPAQETLVRESLDAFEAHVAQPLVARLEEAGWPSPLGGKRIRRRLARTIDRVGRRMAALDSVDDVTRVHQLRIAAKKARYPLELVEDIFVPVAGEMLTELKDLQEFLGEVHDDDVRLTFLPAYAASVPRAEQPGALRLLREVVDGRKHAAAGLSAELARWDRGERAHHLARQLHA